MKFSKTLPTVSGYYHAMLQLSDNNRYTIAYFTNSTSSVDDHLSAGGSGLPEWYLWGDKISEPETKEII